MRFSDIRGHKESINSMRALVDKDRIPHAMLIAGHSGVGKMRLARAFTNYIYCQHRTESGDSCGKCPACLQNDHINNPDVHYIFPRTGGSQKSTDAFVEQWKEFIGRHSYMPPEEWARSIEAGNTVPVIYRNDADEISRTAALSSYAYKYKTYIIWLPERMQPACANALLKLLEEPFPYTIFILVSNEPDKLLPTIFSRTQRFNLKPLEEMDIYKQLSEEGFSDNDARELARLSEGNMLTAIDLSREDGEILEFSRCYIQMMRLAYAKNVGALRLLSEAIVAWGREKEGRFLNYCARLTRESFICNLRVPELNVMTATEAQFNIKFSPFVNNRNVERVMQEIEKAHDDILRNANGKLVMFDFFIKLMMQLRK